MISRYSITTERLGKDFNYVSIVLLADLHNCSLGKSNRKLLQAVDKIKPDIVIAAGDIITKQQKSIPGNAYTLLESLSGKYPVYYSYGNHEQHLEDMNLDTGKYTKLSMQEEVLYKSWVEFKDKLKSLGVYLLDNKSITIMRNSSRIIITGLSIASEFYNNVKPNYSALNQKYLESVLGNNNNEDYRLLIAHNPLFFNEYINWGADLILSGHLHGGLMRLPHFGGLISPQYRFFPKYDAGIFTEKGKSMIVSRGLGTHSHMPRLFNRPELVSILLKSKK
ncbi:MAG TPA: metallophosphoesterase [Mobilitalea sp.]|nr:metallophosphoesterase [Mobilitalea sp.]